MVDLIIDDLITHLGRLRPSDLDDGCRYVVHDIADGYRIGYECPGGVGHPVLDVAAPAVPDVCARLGGLPDGWGEHPGPGRTLGDALQGLRGVTMHV
jgi:hypothetical protein